jgi:hypothetical protein
MREAAPGEQWSEEFRRKYPRHWWSLQRMPESSFRESLIEQLKSRGFLSKKQRKILWWEADKVEAKMRCLEDRCPEKLEPPTVGSPVSVDVVVERVEKNRSRLRFYVIDGWRGHVELAEQNAEVHNLVSHPIGLLHVRGTVIWRRQDYVTIALQQLSLMGMPNG